MLSAQAQATTTATPVDDRSEQSLASSATNAFHAYLRAVDKPDLYDAQAQVLDPGYESGRLQLLEQLLAFVRARSNSNIRNEAVVVRTQGDWALAVYQYDTTIAGKTTRVITTAWMIQWNGVWKQFIIEPNTTGFWNNRRSDYNELQRWFDEHAEAIGS